MQGALALVLAFLMSGPQQSQQPVPDAPVPQAAPGLSGLKDGVTPGKATTPDSADPDAPQPAPAPAGTPAQATPPPTAATPDDEQPQQELPEIGTKGSSPFVLPPAGVNIVVVPVTVRDKKGELVPGLTFRDFHIYENKQRQRITYFSTDAVPLSVGFLIDQSVSAGTMRKVNEALSAVTGAFTPYDEVAVYTYNKSPSRITDFTGAQGNRLTAALIAAKKPGRDEGVPDQFGAAREWPDDQR